MNSSGMFKVPADLDYQATIDPAFFAHGIALLCAATNVPDISGDRIKVLFAAFSAQGWTNYHFREAVVWCATHKSRFPTMADFFEWRRKTGLDEEI